MSGWLTGVPEPWPPDHPVFTVSGKLDDVRPRFLFVNGEAAYFLARLALWSWEGVTGTLLSQQAIELLVKALIRQTGRKPQLSHDIVKLITDHHGAATYFGVLAADTEKLDL